jgi:TonB-dependent starch-binding outer membrane protein SusC
MKKVILILIGMFSLTSITPIHVYGQTNLRSTNEQGRITVKGKVVDENGSPLIGASIRIKGTTMGTMSDMDGSYSLQVYPNSVLSISYVGYINSDIPINKREYITVTLQENSKKIDEVVVVGYGSQKKSDLTGSVAIVNMKEMKKISNSNMSTMLEGKIAGVSVTTDGYPGADPTVRIRGIGSFNDVSPLYVVDGVPVGTTIRDFSPSDIESMQVLKDASAAAIYGARAANGVIIITTKQGLKNTPLKVDYSGYLGFDNIAKRMPVLGRSDYQTINNRSRVNDGDNIWSANDHTSSDYISNVNTDWQKEALKTGIRQDHNINLSGGGQNSSYNASLDYFNSKGTLVGKGPDFSRYTFRLNNKMQVKIFNIQTSVTYSHSHQNDLNSTDQSSFSGGNPPIIFKIISAIPTMKVYDSTTSSGYGTYNVATQGETYSLNMVAMNNILQSYTDVDRLLVSGSVDTDLGKLLGFKKNNSLKYRVNLSWDKTYCKDFNWVPAFNISDFYTNTLAKLDEGYRNYKTGLVENILTYNGTFGKHSINLMLGQTYQADSYNTVTAHGEGYRKPYYKEISNAETTTSASSSTFHYISSYLARLNYEYGDRYLLSGTIRRDGSSRFSKKNRFGYFPSVAAGWKINNEKFFKVDPNLISELKLRASWGKLGNENIGEYQYMETINRGGYVYSFDNTKVYGSSESSVVDNDLKWESKRMANVGLDLTMFGRALDFSTEYYNSRSTDLLVGVTIPYSVGSINDSPTINAGSMENSGFEFTMAYHSHKHPFKYDISANASTLRNRVLRLSQSNTPIYGTGSITKVGKEVGRQYGYVYDGIFQSKEEIASAPFQNAATASGDIKFKDLDGDGTITSADRKDLGSSIPHFSYGINFSASYNNFDFSIFAHGVGKFLVYDYIYRGLMHTSGGLNWDKDIMKSWTSTNTRTNIPRVVYVDSNDNDRDSNRPGWLQNGAYLKVSDIQIGYTVPEHLINKVFSTMRIYASCQNVCTLTKYKGYNPDFAGGVWNPGYNYCSYPIPRTILFGINMSIK